MMRFLFACDSFKGTISSARSAELLAKEAAAFFPNATFSSLEVADGGEGTVDALVASLGGERVTLSVADPLGRPVEASYGLLPGGLAVIEMAAASGLPLLSLAERNPLRTSTYGTGELIADAIARGVRDITLAIGGSATNDCGMGAMRALGARFVDESGEELEGAGADLARVCRIDLSGMDERVAKTTFHVMCDVDNPLVGPRGATYTFGPQKGADPACAEVLEAGMASFAAVLADTFGVDVSTRAGMGAAGGLGAAARLFLDAEVVGGVDRVLDLVGFDEALAGCDLCVTGEGHADSQSAHGKVVSGVAARCRAAGVPCIAVVGGMNADATELFGCGVDALVPTVIEVSSIEEVLAAAETNFRLAAQRTFALLSIGKQLEVTR
ncbi:MAG: glycerate kinase [Collinsella sp.]|nr:glycerate kinase [Collinsella sp.]